MEVVARNGSASAGKAALVVEYKIWQAVPVCPVMKSLKGTGEESVPVNPLFAEAEALKSAHKA